jgi:gliding motility-associated-like protein
MAQMDFIENKGQWNEKINYTADFKSGAFYLENRGFTVLLNNPADMQKISKYYHGQVTKKESDIADEKIILHSFSYNVTFLGASNIAKQIPEKEQKTYNNYFIGSDEKKWAGGCKIFKAVTYNNIYPNIDIRYYSDGDILKYDFIVHPGGNPNAIAMRFDGGVDLSIKNNELIIGTSIGDVKELSPYTYQTNRNGKQDVKTSYKIKDNVVTFDVAKYDETATLVIDPQLVFSTFTGSTSDNWGYTATPGIDGSFYAGGIVFGNGYPASPGAFQTVFAGGTAEGDFSGVDVAIFKFTPNGSMRMYATYLGGAGNEQPHSMIVDGAGNLVVAGRTSSPNFPKKTGLNNSGADFDIFVTKFNATGTSLIGSVKMGGSGADGVNIRPKYITPTGAEKLRRNYGDDARSEVILDASNNIILASCTQSSNFPTVNAFQNTSGGAQDGVILKFTPTLSGLFFSTYFGGNSEDACFVTALHPLTQDIYVGGATSSTNLPGSTTGTIGTNFNGNVDGFVTIIPPTGNTIIKTTYLGTGGVDLVYGLKFDRLGYPYVMGTTTGSWPITPNAAYRVPGAKQFISKLEQNLSAYVYSTVFGTASVDPNISPVAFLVDRCENVYVSGWGGGINVNQNYSSGNTFGLPLVDPLPNVPAPDGADLYFFVMQKNAASQLFGSYYGQNGGLGDHVDGGTSRFDDNGIIYQAICANCAGRTSNPQIFFPTTSGVWAQTNGSSSCNQASVKIAMNFAGIGTQIQSDIDGEINDTLGCVPLTVKFRDIRKKGITYYWNFNSAAPGNINNIDATTTIPEAPPYTFINVGLYRVRLIAEDPSTCNQRDTSYINIRVGNNEATVKFSKQKRNPCTSTTYDFVNLTTSSGGSSFLPNSFVWDYGDGSPEDTTGVGPVNHTYPGPGTYFVKLTLIDTRFCNAPKIFIDTLRINSIVKAIPFLGPLGCAPFTANFKNNSLGGLTWKWEFGDPASGPLDSSKLSDPTHLYNNVGTYRYRLIAYDSTTCNKVDTSAYFTLKVVQKPQAAFTWSPNPPQANVPVSFTNNSSFSDNYLWYFGDDETSTEFAPKHEYNASGNYDAILVAYSIAGCTDTARQIVNTIVNPLLDVPNAFTPGRFGINSVVNVRGFGIGKMDWRIYNRWGKCIFQSNNKRQGWDGTLNGKLQPIDTYTYTLDVEFTDGKKLRKTGDITLIR